VGRERIFESARPATAATCRVRGPLESVEIRFGSPFFSKPRVGVDGEDGCGLWGGPRSCDGLGTML
jgi:hypothetical protein